MFDKTTVSEIQKIADDLEVPAPALLAVAEVESAGVAQWQVGSKKLPPIRFEGHYFYRLLKGKQRDQAVRAGLANPKAGAVKNPNNYAARYEMLARAAKINKEAAYASTSWGVGQVMGDHAKRLGFGTAVKMASKCMEDVAGQVEVMAAYIKSFGLVDELQSKGWAAFAKQYNGKNYRANRYDTKMAAAFKRWSSKGMTPQRSERGAIAELQRNLKSVGFYKGKVDGVYGPHTRAAVRQFQKEQGLVVDGKYGKMTDEALDRVIANKQRDRGEKAIGAGGGAVGSGAAVEVINNQVEKLETISQYSDIITYGVIALVLLGVGLTLYGFIKRRRAYSDGAE
jgi:hypothetical protein